MITVIHIHSTPVGGGNAHSPLFRCGTFTDEAEPVCDVIRTGSTSSNPFSCPSASELPTEGEH